MLLETLALDKFDIVSYENVDTILIHVHFHSFKQGKVIDWINKLLSKLSVYYKENIQHHDLDSNIAKILYLQYKHNIYTTDNNRKIEWSWLTLVSFLRLRWMHDYSPWAEEQLSPKCDMY